MVPEQANNPLQRLQGGQDVEVQPAQAGAQGVPQQVPQMELDPPMEVSRGSRRHIRGAGRSARRSGGPQAGPARMQVDAAPAPAAAQAASAPRVVPARAAEPAAPAASAQVADSHEVESLRTEVSPRTTRTSRDATHGVSASRRGAESRSLRAQGGVGASTSAGVQPTPQEVLAALPRFQDVQVGKAKARPPPTFGGVSSDLSVHAWLRTFVSYFELTHEPVARWVPIAETYLVGAALEQWSSVRPERPNWEEFKVHLMSHHHQPMSLQETAHKLATLKVKEPITVATAGDMFSTLQGLVVRVDATRPGGPVGFHEWLSHVCTAFGGSGSLGKAIGADLMARVYKPPLLTSRAEVMEYVKDSVPRHQAILEVVQSTMAPERRRPRDWEQAGPSDRPAGTGGGQGGPSQPGNGGKGARPAQGAGPSRQGGPAGQPEAKRPKVNPGDAGFRDLSGLSKELKKARQEARLCLVCGGPHYIKECPPGTPLNTTTVTHDGRDLKVAYPPDGIRKGPGPNAR